VSPDRLLHAVDPAFGLAEAAKTRLSATLRELQLEPGTFLSLNLRSGEAAEPLLHRLAGFLLEAIQRLGLKRVLLFGMQRFRENNDGEILARLSSVIWMPEEAGMLKGVLAQSRAILSCRYHGAVFGLSSAVPTIGLVMSREYGVKLAVCWTTMIWGAFVFRPN
jgi:polysaccharide pyruvyl transferase WcaK-like protein